MIEIRIHGRGGQGAVIASEALASAFFKDKKAVQTFPEFGAERRGAPTAAYLRVDTKPIQLRCRVYTPDHIIVLDPGLLRSINVTEGLKNNGWVLVNSDKTMKSRDFPHHTGKAKFRIAIVNATQIAIKHGLGPRTAPIVNTAILGAFCKLSGIVKLTNLKKAITKIVPVNKEKNLAATREAYNTVKF